jgi:hypothetical protein
MVSAEEYKETQKSTAAKTQPINICQISTSKDTLLPIMDVESSMDEPNKSTKLRRTFSSCDLVYIKPAADSRKLPSGHSVGANKNSQQYRSHEILSSGGSPTNTESSGQWYIQAALCDIINRG